MSAQDFSLSKSCFSCTAEQVESINNLRNIIYAGSSFDRWFSCVLVVFIMPKHKSFFQSVLWKSFFKRLFFLFFFKRTQLISEQLMLWQKNHFMLLRKKNKVCIIRNYIFILVSILAAELNAGRSVLGLSHRMPLNEINSNNCTFMKHWGYISFWKKKNSLCLPWHLNDREKGRVWW